MVCAVPISLVVLGVFMGEKMGISWLTKCDAETCRQCKKGLFQMCENEEINGVSRDGGCECFLSPSTSSSSVALRNLHHFRPPLFNTFYLHDPRSNPCKIYWRHMALLTLASPPANTKQMRSTSSSAPTPVSVSPRTSRPQNTPPSSAPASRSSTPSAT